MESYNSGGSLQSSRGGDDEYDSRAAVSARFIPNPQQPVFLDPIRIPNYLPDPNMALPKPFTTSFQPPVGSDPPPNPNPSPRNPRKRSRASRRAPTTVLTTDTTNFRAMVQEFTGIPSPPFSNSPYLRRPFAQKLQSPFPFLGTSAASAAGVNGSVSATNDVVSVSSINYKLPNPDIFSINQIQNPSFSKFPIFNSVIDSKSETATGDSNPVELISQTDHVQFRGINQIPPIFISSDQNNPKLTDVEKPPDAAPARGEGTVESWICSSE